MKETLHMIETKKHTPSKLLACALSVVLVFGATPATAFAEPETNPNDIVSATDENTVTDGRLSGAEGQTDAEASADVEAPAHDQTESTPYASEITDEDISSALNGAGESALNRAMPLSSETFSARSSVEGDVVKLFSGSDRYDTAAMQSTYGWNSSAVAIVAGSEGWPDALAASSLAGGLNCPILLTPGTYLSEYTADTLTSLGVTEVIIVGGEPTVSPAVKSAIEGLGITTTRLSGVNRAETQLAIYEYGNEHDLWKSDLLLVTSGLDFSDALSASPIAFAACAPVFLADTNGNLSESQEIALIEGARGSKKLFKHALTLGGSGRVSSYTEGFVKFAAQLSSSAANPVERIEGVTRYDTSARIASWGVNNGYLSWDGVAFATGSSPNDALGGGALQGSEGAALLLVSEGLTDYALNAIDASDVSSIKFFGGTPSVSSVTRGSIITGLGLIDILTTDYGISLSKMADLEVNAVKDEGYPQYSKSEVLAYLDPNNFSFGTKEYYQFAILSDGYLGKVSASQLDSFIATNGSSGMLAGTGQAFIDAAKQYELNEVYLLSNGILESGWGKSALAMGYYYAGGIIDNVYYSAGTYYNFFGIGAYDTSPLSGGRKMAITQGWNSPRAAVFGAAKWISNNYIHPTVLSAAGSGQQNTLYRMKWDVKRAASSSSVWHQYATSRTWPTGIASVMNDCYRYNNISVKQTGLRFDVPRYN